MQKEISKPQLEAKFLIMWMCVLLSKTKKNCNLHNVEFISIYNSITSPKLGPKVFVTLMRLFLYIEYHFREVLMYNFL